MRSLIHKNPTTNETRWCVANVVADLTVDIYIQAVDLGFRDDASHKAENFQWVEETQAINMTTHEYKNGVFVERVEEVVVAE